MDSKDNHAQKPTEHLGHAAAGEEQEMVVAEYPQRPWEPDCSYYLKFGRCGYGTKCMFNHPPKPSGGQWQRHAIAGDGDQQGQETEYPQRPGEADCSYYVKFGRCRYGMKCMFNHPPKPSGGQWQRHAIAGDGEKQGQETEYQQRPGQADCSYYVKSGSCKYGMSCMFNHPPRKLVCFQAGACKCIHHEVEEVKLNSLGLPLRPTTGLCSYYMHKGICKFGTNCKFHHPDRSESEQEKWDADASQGSSQQNFFSRLGDIITPDPNLFGPLGPSPLELPTPFLLRHSSKEPIQVYSCAEQSGYQQLGDSHFEPAEPVRYTRDQLLQLREAQQIVDVSKDIFELKQCIDMELRDEDHSWANNDSNVNTRSYNRYDLADSREWRPRSSVQTLVSAGENYNIHEEKELYGSGGKQKQFCEHDQLCGTKFDSKAQVIVDCEKFPFAALESEHFSNTILEDMQESSSAAPEINLVLNTTTASKQCFCDASNTGKIDKDVHKKCDQEILRKSFTEESSSAESKKNYMHEEFTHPVEFSENVCPSNSMASLQIDQVACSFSEILELMCRCWSGGGHG